VLGLASQTFASWNQTREWLRRLDTLHSLKRCLAEYAERTAKFIASLGTQHGSRIETHRATCGEETRGETDHREQPRDREQRHRIHRAYPD
jgi:hypothetical protein